MYTNRANCSLTKEQRIVFSTNGTNRYPHPKINNNLDTDFIPFPKVNSSCIADLNVKSKTKISGKKHTIQSR